MPKIFITVVLAALLAACSPATNARLSQVKSGVIEPRIDVAYDALVRTWCDFPAQTHNRAIERQTIQPRSLTDNCPAWRDIRDSLIGSAMERLGVGMP